MIPIINIGMRAARSASEQVVRSMDRLDFIHTEGKNLNEHLQKLAQFAEGTMAYELEQIHPDQKVIGEFSGTLNDPQKPSNKYWHVNAIDGLEQYAHSLPYFCLTMGCYEDNKLTHSIVIEPISGDEYYASRGRGAYLNERRMRVSKRKQLLSSQIHGGYWQASASLAAVDDFHGACRNLAERGARNYSHLPINLALAYMACGKFDGLWHSHLDSTNIPALLLAQEAGALMCDFKGGAALNNHQLVAANPKLLKQLIKSLHQ